MTRIGVLASGSGSNFEALARDLDGQQGNPRVVLLISDVPGSGALARAATLGIPSAVVARTAFADRHAFDQELATRLSAAGVELVCLAGFMRILGPQFLTPWGGRTLNIHPSLLPSFPGLHAVRQALDWGVAVTGCTVHVVDQGVDTGPILAQAAVSVLPDDTETSLAARIHDAEHHLYPRTVRQFCSGALPIAGRRAQRTDPGP